MPICNMWPEPCSAANGISDGIDLVSCSEVVCNCRRKAPVKSMTARHKEDRVYVEADGELLGRLPARMTMAPDALSLVVPA